MADWHLIASTVYSLNGPLMTQKTTAQWQHFVEGCLDFRPAEGIYRIDRAMFTEPELFDLEMELIFEKNWIYACHESEIAYNHDFMTMRAGRQPLIITRDGEGKLNALINACRLNECPELVNHYKGQSHVRALNPRTGTGLKGLRQLLQANFLHLTDRLES